MNPLKLPKQEDVNEFSFGNMDLKIVELTDENRSSTAEMVLSMYIGEKCKYCLYEFVSLFDIRERNVVYAGYHEHGRIACKKCWDENNK